MSILVVSIMFSIPSVLAQQNKLKVFLSCDCDGDFLQQELTYLDFVRDRLLADVSILQAVQRSGSGEQHTLYFFGGNKFSGSNDTLVVNVDSDKTSDDIRRFQMKAIEIGLAPYLYKKGWSNDIMLSVQRSEETSEQEDKWKNWVFTTRLNGWLNGQEQYFSSNQNLNFNIRKVTDKVKYIAETGINRNINIFEMGGTTVKSTLLNKYANALLVHSLSDHWSLGFDVKNFSSIYRNMIYSGSIRPAIEYNIYPYSESTKRQFTASYRVGPGFNKYIEKTIFGKQQEAVWSHYFNLGYSIRDQWGNLELNVNASQFLHNPELYSIGSYASISLRLFKGMFWELSGGYNFIKDQISLSGEGLTSSQVLLQQKQFKTNYSYWMNTGFSYTFGSIYNSVVNTRFD